MFKPLKLAQQLCWEFHCYYYLCAGGGSCNGEAYQTTGDTLANGSELTGREDITVRILRDMETEQKNSLYTQKRVGGWMWKSICRRD